MANGKDNTWIILVIVSLITIPLAYLIFVDDDTTILQKGDTVSCSLTVKNYGAKQGGILLVKDLSSCYVLRDACTDIRAFPQMSISPPEMFEKGKVGVQIFDVDTGAKQMVNIYKRQNVDLDEGETKKYWFKECLPTKPTWESRLFVEQLGGGGNEMDWVIR